MLILDHTFNAKRYSPLVYDKVPDLKEGTLSYDDYWDEMDYYCINGYKPKGMPEITGEHFFYLNMCRIEMLPQGSNRKIDYNPYYRELDHRLFKETFEAKKHKYGLIIGKPRRVGLSWFGALQMVYEMLFFRGNRVGICAGKQDKADAFYAKVMYLLKFIRDEYKVARLKKTDQILKLGYIDSINKQKEECGLLSEMLIRTMFVDSAGFEGESLGLAVFEEAGLFQNLIQSYKSTEPCFREGANQFGTPLIYGTGGEIDKGAKGYMEMWNTAEAYNLKKIFISADEYYPGDGEVDPVTKIKKSFFDISTGKTDREAARKWILEERDRAKKSKDGYIKHIQNYPLKESEIFIKTTGGILDRAKLNDQYQRWSEGECPYDIRTGRLEWVDDDVTKLLLQGAKDLKQKAKIRIQRGSKVKWVDDERGTIRKIADPINKDGMQHMPDIAACDSYDEEVEEGKGSLGATVVYRTYAGPHIPSNMPVAILNERGDSSNDDTFYENNVKLAIYYNYQLLIEYSKIAIEKYFKDIGAYKYLKEKPDLRKEVLNSKAKNEYGFRMGPEAKKLVTRLLKSEVLQNCHSIWFDNLLLDLMDYGDKNTDMAMALGICLVYKLEIFDDIVEEYENETFYGDENALDTMTYYDIDDNGNVKIKHFGFESINGNSYDMKQMFEEKQMSELDQIRYKKKLQEETKIREQASIDHYEYKKMALQNFIKDEISRQKR